MFRSLVLAGALALAAAVAAPEAASAASLPNQEAVAGGVSTPVETVQYYGYRRRGYYGRRVYGPRRYYGRRYYGGPRYYRRGYYGGGAYVGPRGLYLGY